MGAEPVGLDSLRAHCGRSEREVCAELLQLELSKRVAALPGGLF